MKTIVTTESAGLWHDFADSIQLIVTIADVYGDTEVSANEAIIIYQNAVTDFQNLESDIKQQKVETAIVFYQQCEHAIANDLIRGKSVEEAANKWLKHTEALLQFHKQNRRAVKLFNLEQALASPSRLTQQLKVIGVNLAIELEAKPPVSWQLLFACQYVRQEVGLKDLNERLNASSLPVADGLDITLDSSVLLSDLTDKESEFKQLEVDVKASRASLSQLSLIERDYIALQQSLNTSNNEIAKLSEINNQLREEQQEKERTYSEIEDKLEQKNAEILALKNEINTEATNFKNIAEDLQNESELVSFQLLQIQDELEKYCLDLSRERQQRTETESDFKQKNEVFNQQLAQLQKQLEKTNTELLNEKQKCAEKESELSKLVKNSTLILDNVKQENELLNLHFAQTQDELERYYDENKNVENKIEELKQQNKKFAIDKLNLESQIKKMRSAEQELSQKLKVIIAVERSKSDSHSLSLKQLKIKELELAKLNNQFDKANVEIDILNHRLKQASSEIVVIKSSMLWKSAEPMRKLARAVQKVDKKRAKLQQDIGLLLTSEYFDAQWYLDTYPDVAASNSNPAEHYLKYGAREGRFPSPKFDGNWYLKRYPDIAIADINPLIHFIKFGISEGRSASPKMLTNQSNKIRG